MIHFQLQQFLTLLLLLAVAKETAYVYLSWVSIISILCFTFIIEHILIYIKNKKYTYISFSALSTAIGVILLMFSAHYWIYLFVILVALLQKHFLRWNNKHMFNPSNFAIVFALTFFFNDAHIVLGQLGDEVWVQAVLVVLATAILVRVKRWFIPLGFVVFYLLLQYFIIVLSDPVFTLEDIYERFYTVSFVLFVVFMLTDPSTTPHKFTYQSIFAFAVAFGATAMDYIYGFRVQHLFLMLFSVTVISMSIGNFRKGVVDLNDYFKLAGICMLLLGMIIFIQAQVPYYFEMNS